MKNRYTLRTVAALFTAVAAFSFTPAHAAVDCSNQSWDVSDLTDWNDAIVCFNGKSTGDYTINLTTNITLTASSTTIESPASASSTLTINGGGNAIDGQETSGVRPITVAADTTVGIKDTTITGGKGNDFGGGIYNAGKLTVTNSTVSGNKATKEGGGIYNKSGTLVVRNSTITNNEVDEYGGGLLNSNGTTIELVNSTVSGNRAGILGGGIYNIAGADLTLTNSTVSNNTATDNYGGIVNGGTLTLTNTIIANNKKGTGASVTLSDCEMSGTNAQVVASHSLIQDSANACGLNNGTNGNIIGQDPKLGDLANNGGATQTHALLLGSPAIDKGTSTGAPSEDQRGFARDGTTPDIGAFEAFDGCTDTTSAATWSVADEAALTGAILCFNAKTRGTHTINLTADIDLLGSTPAIDNNTSGVTLTINGDGFKIDGLGKEGVRPITVAPSTTVSINHTTITGGKTVTNGLDDEKSGGGIFNGGTLTLTNSTVRNNSAIYSGGINNNGTLTLTNSTVSGNTARYGGGGINNNGTLTLTNSTVSGNTATNGNGGGIFNSIGKLTLTNSTVSGNTATNGSGGGIFNSIGKLTLTNSTVSGNTAKVDGGGISNGNQLTLINSTISGNTANRYGGGIDQFSSQSNALNLTNTLIANNTKGTGASAAPSDCELTGAGAATGSNNLIQSGDHACSLTATNGNIIGVTAADLNLGPLANNGGATQTHALLLGSPAIDKGTTTGTGIPATDQRGVSRPQGTKPDIGAVEFYDCSATAWNASNEDDLSQAIRCFNAKSTAANYTINLTGNALLSTSTPAINNTTSNITLTINGNGKTIDGRNIVGVRPITVAPSTTVSIKDTTITGGKTATSGTFDDISGGGILNQGMLTLTNSTVRNNKASLGGGISNYDSNATLELTNSTVSGNTAINVGGGIENAGTLTLTNSTVSGNTAGDNGGGIYNYGTLELTNSIIANSTGGDCVNDGGSVTAANNNLIESTGAGACGIKNSATVSDNKGNIIGEDPKLGPLANNGGATQTHALQSGSPAFNAGTSTGAPDKDQRGISRTANGAPDIGAYEARVFTLSVDVDISNTTGTGSISQSPLSTSYMEGSTVTIQGLPSAGSSMLWGGACTSGNVSGNNCTLTMDANKTVTYAFVSGSSGGTTFTLATSTVGTGGGTIGVSPFSSSGQYNSGVSLRLTATPDGNSQFVKWGGACSGTSTTCDLSMDGDKTVTATFTKKTVQPPTNGVFFKDSFEKTTP